MNTLTWKKHQEIHDALVIHLINMCDKKTGTPPSKERIFNAGICSSIEDAKAVMDSWVLEDIDSAVEKALCLKFLGQNIVLENKNGDKCRLKESTRNNRKTEWKEFFKTR